ncbi:protein timeless homolog [Frankliniella occidentalis]|uniref:Protein timeless homolog n=1 Tax=Frankliniella occidentalis TaxID=133901 RepID=A0A9C6U2U1_FRAOC|nr:protein timeless homolog [Frankliniella occidentalis]
MIPFDAASDKDIDDQRVDCMRRIYTLLKQHSFEEAVGLMRAAREVWPENEVFGSAHMAPEEEFAALREVFFADIAQDPEVVRAAEEARRLQEQPEQDEEEEYGNNEDDDEEDEEGGGSTNYSEQELQFPDFLKRMVHSRAVQAAGYLLQTFEKNSVFTNHCLAKLLHRIAWEAKMPGMLFQASLFRSFQRIFKSPLPQHKELQKLAQYVVKKFVELATQNPLIYVELLFWKTSRDAYEIEEGYGSYKEKSTAEKKSWKEEEEDELRVLFAEFERDQPGGDVVDWILRRLINQDRTAAGVKKKLKELFLIVPKTKNKPPKEWGEQEINELKELYDQFRDSGSTLDDILTRLTVKRPKVRVIDKLLELGLVNDRKELRKKGGKSKSGNLRRGAPAFDDSELLDTATDTDDDEPSGNNVKASKKDKSERDRMALKNARRGKTGRAPPGQVTAMLLQVVSSGFSGGLQWLKDSFDEAAEDLEKDPSSEDVDGVPLVPVGEDADSAMDSPIFQRLLQALGVLPPFDEQESYWRIPGDMKAPEMRQKAENIQSALDGTLTMEQVSDQNQKTVSENDQINGDSSDSEDEFSALRRITATSRAQSNNDKTEAAFDSLLKSNPARSAEKPKAQKEKRKRFKIAKSDDSDNEESVSQNKEERTNQKSGTSINLDSDSDSDFESAPHTSTQIQRRAVIDSDSENESSAPSASQNSQRVRQSVITSDSESESEVSRSSSVKFQQARSSPLKESSIMNSSQKRAAISSDEEMDTSNNVNSRPNKGTKHFLSSSEDSAGENSPKKARSDVSGLRM